MKIHEYQAKGILAEFGIPVPQGGLAKTASEAREIAAGLGGKVVIKAQVHAGGRGKGGGIKTAASPEEAELLAGQIIGMQLVTPQTPPQGVKVKSVLVEEAVQYGRELYLGIIVDGTAGVPVMMASAAGGMDIEEVAAKTPEKIFKAYIDPLTGLQPFQGRKLAYGMSLAQAQVRPAADLMANLYRAFQAKDCSLAEINPLVVTAEGKLVALDAKLNFDDNALYRHPDLREMRDPAEEDPLEVEASKYDVSYIKLNGSIGCLVNGAGLAMATMDIIKLMGSEPANFLDVGGGASTEKVANAFRILVSDPSVKTVLVNVFGGILRCDIVASGIVEAAKEIDIRVPIVVAMRGTNVEQGKQILADSGLSVILASDLHDAAQKAVAAEKSQRG